MNAILRYGITTLAIVGLMSSNATMALAAKAPPQAPAQLIVEDNAALFSPTKIEEAKRIVAESMGDGSRQVHVETYMGLDLAERKQFQAESDKDKFWKDWAAKKVTNDRGVVILITKEPAHVHVIADKQMQEHGFDSSKRQAMRQILIDEFRKGSGKPDEERKAFFDTGLVAAAQYAKSNLPHSLQAPSNKTDANPAKADGGGGSNIMSYICIGLAIMLGVWLIFGLIRAFTGGGGGGGGPGGGGYGGGGGGFGSSLLGGLFGAMAGMWMYNNLFGGHTASAMGGDNLADGGGDYGGETGGAGDFSGDGGTGGDYGGGDTGGGGDWGGGGDAGGGDWGGGGGDF